MLPGGNIYQYTTDSKERVGNAFKQKGTGGALTLGTLLPKGQNVVWAEQFRDAPLDPSDTWLFEKRQEKTKGVMVIPTAPIVRTMLKSVPADKMGIWNKQDLDGQTVTPQIMQSVSDQLRQGSQERSRQESQDRL
jgi:hypothetical protein